MFNKVLDFWFDELEPKHWYKKDPELDVAIRERFGKTHAMAVAGELFEWRESAEGSLAEIIVLDQFSRNIFRDHPEAFAYDPLALALSQFAISKGYDLALPSAQRTFLYMPFMHSESLIVHEHALKLFEHLGSESNLDYEIKHKAIIDRFGRYPHRNEILGRHSTEEELEFLSQPGSRF